MFSSHVWFPNMPRRMDDRHERIFATLCHRQALEWTMASFLWFTCRPYCCMFSISINTPEWLTWVRDEAATTFTAVHSSFEIFEHQTETFPFQNQNLILVNCERLHDLDVDCIRHRLTYSNINNASSSSSNRSVRCTLTRLNKRDNETCFHKRKLTTICTTNPVNQPGKSQSHNHQQTFNPTQAGDNNFMLNQLQGKTNPATLHLSSVHLSSIFDSPSTQSAAMMKHYAISSSSTTVESSQPAVYLSRKFQYIMQPIHNH